MHRERSQSSGPDNQSGSLDDHVLFT